MILRTVDIETTGFVPPGAEVIELGAHDVACLPSGAEARMIGHTRSWLYQSERPCPPEVVAVHHILPEDTANCDRFDGRLAEQTMDDLSVDGSPAFYVAHNAEFEVAFLGHLFARPFLCTYKAALRVWPEAPSHANQSLMYWLGLHRGLEAHLRHPPHRAGPDAYVTAALLVCLLGHCSLEDMVVWSAEPRLLPTCPIGKFRGSPWPQVDMGFLEWMLRQPDMELDLKWNARRELDRRRTAHHSGD